MLYIPQSLLFCSTHIVIVFVQILPSGRSSMMQNHTARSSTSDFRPRRVCDVCVTSVCGNLWPHFNNRPRPSSHSGLGRIRWWRSLYLPTFTFPYCFFSKRYRSWIPQVDNFPYGATNFHSFLQKGIYQSGKLDIILFHIEWKSGGAIQKLFRKLGQFFKETAPSDFPNFLYEERCQPKTGSAVPRLTKT